MDRYRANKKWAVCVALVCGSMLASHAARAADDPSCSTGGCGWSLTVDNVELLSGSFEENSNGNLYLPSALSGQVSLGDGSYVSITTISGDIDPVLGFSFKAGTGAVGKTFSFSFSLPIALSGPIDANSSVSYSLTSLTAAGAQITPLFSHLIVASEVDSSVGGLPPLNKGVDVGNTFGFSGGPQTLNSQVYVASNSFVGSASYDLMSVVATFSLSPYSQVAVSGFVQQVMAVPEPGGSSMALAGLALVAFLRIRRKPSQRCGRESP